MNSDLIDDDDKKQLMKGMFIPLIIVAAIVAIVLFVFNKCGSDKEYVEKEILPLNYKAIVKSKYIDYNNHGCRTIEIINDGRIEFVSDRDWESLYDLVWTGDSIVKKEGYSNLFIIKKQIDTVIEIKYNYQNKSHFIKR